MARALLLSLLVRQHMALKEKFRARYPHPWLVWEAGGWNVSETGAQSVATTLVPEDALRDCLPPGDAMCFELVRGADRGSLQVGRASHNTFVINDATVSREHLLLHPAPDGSWTVEALRRASSPVSMDGRRLEAGHRVLLTPNARLELGDVHLTFHDPDGFHARIGRIAALTERQTAHAS